MQFQQLACKKNTPNGTLVFTDGKIFYSETGPLVRAEVEDFLLGMIEHLHEIGLEMSSIISVNTVVNREGVPFGHSYIYVEDCKLCCVLRGFTPEGFQLVCKKNETPHPLEEQLHCISLFRKGTTGDCLNYVFMRNVAKSVKFREATTAHGDRIVVISGLGSKKEDVILLPCSQEVVFTELIAEDENVRHIMIGHKITDEGLLGVLSDDYEEKYEEQMNIGDSLVFDNEKLEISDGEEKNELIIGDLGSYMKVKYLNYDGVDFDRGDGPESYTPTFTMANIKNAKNRDDIKHYAIKSSGFTPVPSECRKGKARDDFINAYRLMIAFLCREGEYPNIYVKNNGEMIVEFDHKYCTCEIVMTLSRVLEVEYEINDVKKKYTMVFSNIQSYGAEEGVASSSSSSESRGGYVPRGDRGSRGQSYRGRGGRGNRGGYSGTREYNSYNDDYSEHSSSSSHQQAPRGKKKEKREVYVDDEGFTCRR